MADETGGNRVPDETEGRRIPVHDRGFGNVAFSSNPETALRRLTQTTAGSRVAFGGGFGAFGEGAAGPGMGGIPGASGLPISLASNSPYSVFTQTQTRPDQIALYRYFADNEPYVGRAIELHSQLPMSRLSIGPPKGVPSKEARNINRIYEAAIERTNLLAFNLEVARDYWTIGDVYVWVEWDHKRRTVKDLFVLPAEYMHSIIHPFLRNQEIIIYARPLVDTVFQRRQNDSDLWALVGDADVQELFDDIEDQIPEELKDILAFGEGHPLNTDPRKGSFVYHLARDRRSHEAYGHSLQQRCISVLLELENLRNARLGVTSRNMQPKHLVAAEGCSETELLELRDQVDLAMLSPSDYPIVTSYPFTWTILGATDRIPQVEADEAMLRKLLAVGLATTEEMLTGQATYGGQRLTIELSNNMYLLFREDMKKLDTECVFKPIAHANGHFEFETIDTWVHIRRDQVRVGDDLVQTPDGELRKRKIIRQKKYLHSQIRFNRLSVRDNAEVYDQLFQLHQKGSLALRYLLDIHNIDSEENATAIVEDVATVRHPSFNRLLEAVYVGLAERLMGETDLFRRIVEGLNLDPISQKQGQPAPGTPTDASQLGPIGGGGGLDTMMPAGDFGMPPGGGPMPPPLGGPGEPGGPEGGDLGTPTPGANGQVGGPPGTPGLPGEIPPGGPVTSSRRRRRLEPPETRLGRRVPPEKVEAIARRNEERRKAASARPLARESRNGHPVF